MRIVSALCGKVYSPLGNHEISANNLKEINEIVCRILNMLGIHNKQIVGDGKTFFAYLFPILSLTEI